MIEHDFTGVQNENRSCKLYQDEIKSGGRPVIKNMCKIAQHASAIDKQAESNEIN